MSSQSAAVPYRIVPSSALTKPGELAEVACPPDDPADYSGSLTRQFSLWPFGSRQLRLHVLADLARDNSALGRAVVRAMQEEYLKCESGSQTTAVRSVLMAAHFALRQRNRTSLPSDRVSAAGACAVSRGSTYYIALVGDASAIWWDGHVSRVHRSPSRVSRPLGGDPIPKISLWSASPAGGERLILVCGGAWGDDTLERVERTLREEAPESARSELARVFSGSRGAARVVLVDGIPGDQREREDQRPQSRRLSEVPNQALPPAPAAPAGSRTAVARSSHSRLRFLGAVAVVAVVAGVGALINPFAPPSYVSAAHEAQDLLDQAGRTSDPQQAHALATTAEQLATQAASGSPTEFAPLLAHTEASLQSIDRAFPVNVTIIAGVEASASSIVQTAASPRGLYVLQMNPDVLALLRSDASGQPQAPADAVIGQGARSGDRVADAPAAMAFVPGGPGSPGALLVLDRARGVFKLGDDGSLLTDGAVNAFDWQQVGGLAADGPDLFLVDAAASRLVQYPNALANSPSAPRQLIGPGSSLSNDLAHVVGEAVTTDIYLQRDDGAAERIDRSGQRQPFSVEPPDVTLGPISGMAPDGTGGLYLADPQHARIVETTSDGHFIRQLRPASGDADMRGVRSLSLSSGGQRLFGVSGTDLISIELPTDQSSGVDIGSGGATVPVSATPAAGIDEPAK